MIFKREKEVARSLEFDGLYVTEQPPEEDIKGQWDRLVINTPYVQSHIINWDDVILKSEKNTFYTLSLRSSLLTPIYNYVTYVMLQKCFTHSDVSAVNTFLNTIFLPFLFYFFVFSDHFPVITGINL